MKIIRITWVLLLIFWFSSASQFNISIVKTIGDERRDYTFFEVGSTIISADKSIYVSDLKGYSIAKYSWDGIFQKRIGQKGKGPGHFEYPYRMGLVGKNIYIFDMGTMSITTLDSDLNVIDYLKIRKNFFNDVIPIKKDLFIGIKSPVGIKMLGNKNHNMNMAFIFNEFEKIETSFHQISKSFFEKNLMKSIRNSRIYSIRTELMNENKNILISNLYLKNPVEFFLYDIKGVLQKKMKYEYKNCYKSPTSDDLQFREKGFPYVYMITSLISNQNYYFFNVLPLKYIKTSKIKEDRHFLIFNKKGKFVKRLDVGSKFGYRFFQITDDNYLIGIRYDIEKEEEKIVISKIEISDK